MSELDLIQGVGRMWKWELVAKTMKRNIKTSQFCPFISVSHCCVPYVYSDRRSICNNLPKVHCHKFIRATKKLLQCSLGTQRKQLQQTQHILVTNGTRYGEVVVVVMGRQGLR